MGATGFALCGGALALGAAEGTPLEELVAMAVASGAATLVCTGAVVVGSVDVFELDTAGSGVGETDGCHLCLNATSPTMNAHTAKARTPLLTMSAVFVFCWPFRLRTGVASEDVGEAVRVAGPCSAA
jgi:hypothetical protein